MRRRPAFGYVVLGLPGSGKTTLVHALREVFELVGRPCSTVNLDFSNQLDEGAFDFDCRELVRTADAQELLRLGPNGALLYCLDLLWRDEHRARLLQFVADHRRRFLLFDLPGQVECYVAHPVLRGLLQEVARAFNAQLAAVNLTDVSLVSGPGRYLQFELNGVCIAQALQLPFLNVLSKVDLLPAGAAQERVERYLAELRRSGDALTAALLRELEAENAGAHYELSARDSRSVVRLVHAADAVLGYARGACGEYEGRSAAEVRRAEQFLEVPGDD